MNLRENISLAINGLIANKMRAILTMLGIIIGIGAVIAITCIGDAMTSAITESMESMGINNISVQVVPKDPNASYTHTDDDLFTDEMLEKYQIKFNNKIQGIAMSNNVGNAKITRRHEIFNVNVIGANDGYASGASGKKIDMAKGRFISDGDMQRASYVAAISEKLADSLFAPGQNPVGQQVKIELELGRKSFTIVGVYKKEKAKSFMMGSSGDTTEFYIPLSTSKGLSNEKEKGCSYFYVAATKGLDYQQFALDTQQFFDEHYFVKNKSMHCETQSLGSMIDEAEGQLGTISMAVSIIAGISLLVGGIGVMNIMLVSVTERTREIGIRKALGAPDSAIRTQFIVESVIICVIGGVFGILLGTGLGALGGMLLNQNAAPSVRVMAIAVGFSMMIGIFFGYYPANKAAKLDPIEALRYE